MTESVDFLAGPVAPRQGMVFLSHASVDRTLADWVAAQVKAMGIICYMAEDDPQPGDALSEKVRGAIERSDALLALLTHAGHGSIFVHQEIGAAVQSGKLVLALVDKHLQPKTLGMLDGAEYITFDADDLSSASADLITGLRRVAERRGAVSGPVMVTAQPTLQFQAAVQLNLTGTDILVGLLVVAAIVGLIYIASQSGGTGGPSA